MKSLSIETSQNVKINYRIATVGDRIIATLVDIVIIIVYLIMISILNSSIGDPVMGVPHWLTVIELIPILFYNFIQEYFFDGQTIGKKALKVKIMKLNGGRATLADHFLRWVLRFVDIMLSSGSIALLSVILTKKGQRLGDLASSTTVVSLKSSAKLKDSIYTEVSEEHIVTYDQVIHLKDKDIEVIQQVIQLCEKSPDEISTLNAKDKLADKLAHVLNVKVPKEKEFFFRQIVKDYNYLTQKMD